LRAYKLKMGHVTLTTPLLAVAVIQKLGFYSIPVCKLQNLIIPALAIPKIALGAQTFEVNHVTLTMHPYAGTSGACLQNWTTVASAVS